METKMQRINSGSNRGQKSSGGGLYKFDVAQMYFQDIENIIEQEMLATPAMQATYDSNVVRIKKSKRKRPGLIRNFNTKKTRQVINNMEFDPDTNTWIGNEDVLSLFSPPQPALIINKGRHDKEKVVNNMTWDPVEKIWKGNDKISRKFITRKPALITPISLNSSAYLQQRDNKGMVFDTSSLRWVGNDSELDVFAQIDKLTDDGVEVGNEFYLSSPLTRSFVDCANRHRSSLSGWFADGGIDRNAHLYAIRNMSILRIVRDIKQRRTTFVDLDSSSADVPERDISSPIGAAVSGNGNSADATEDYDDFDLTGKTLSTKPKLPEASGEWDAEFDMDEKSVPQPAATKDEKAKSGDDEDWDDVFGSEDVDTLRNKLKSQMSSPKLEIPQQGSFFDYSALRKARKAAAQPAQQPASAPEEDNDGLELPSGGPLRLVPADKRAVQPEADVLMEPDEKLAGLTSKSPDSEFEDGVDEDEDADWADVDIPPTFPASPLSASSMSLSLSLSMSLGRSQHIEEIDEDGELQLTGDKLELKPPTRVSDDEDTLSDEDMEDGLEIPDNLVLSLKR